MTMKPGSDQDSLQEPAKKRLARVAYVFADVRLSLLRFPERNAGNQSLVYTGVIVRSSHRKRQAEYIGSEARYIHLLPPVPLLSSFLLHMFIARNATRTLKRNPNVANLTTLRTFHTSLTNLNKMSEETKQQIKTAFPELLNIAKQKTSLPGREKDMTPIAKHTELECVASLVKIRQSERRNVGTLNGTFFLYLSCV